MTPPARLNQADMTRRSRHRPEETAGPGADQSPHGELIATAEVSLLQKNRPKSGAGRAFSLGPTWGLPMHHTIRIWFMNTFFLEILAVTASLPALYRINNP